MAQHHGRFLPQDKAEMAAHILNRWLGKEVNAEPRRARDCSYYRLREARKLTFGRRCWFLAYFSDGSRIYSDKIVKFVCECDKRSGGAVMRRFKACFNRLIIDEIQDMARYDLDLPELILKSSIPVTFVGDHRQATFATNNSPKNKAFSGPAIIKKFEQWKKAGLVAINYECHTYRCNQAVADLGDSFFPHEPKTISRNEVMTDHDGVFLVASSNVDAYMAAYSPQALRYLGKTMCGPYRAMNFGESKGLTFDRVLIYPHGKPVSWLTSGCLIPKLDDCDACAEGLLF